METALRQRRYAARAAGPTRLLQERELRGNAAAVDAALQGHGALVRRLRCESVLEAHEGCVNHLRWSRDGRLLASGSDDHRVVVWDYATRQPREVIDTGHVQNIFAVCFVPGTNDHIIASGAMDNDVRIHYAPFRGPDCTKLFRVHRGRVKDIASSPGVPKVFWTAAEDALVYQFDVRALPRMDGMCDEPDTSGVLIRLGRTRHGKLLRGMGMAVHPHDPTKVALACGDFYTRLYDRRMLRIQQHRSTVATSNGATIPAEIFAPPHLHLDEFCEDSVKRTHDSSHGTSIQFSPDGTELLANYHNDHIYLFKIGSGPHPIQKFDKVEESGASSTSPVWQNGMHMDLSTVPTKTSAEDVMELTMRGANAVRRDDFTHAIRCLSEACQAAESVNIPDPFLADMYHTAAKAYIGRSWNADTYLAATYCRRALELTPDNREVDVTYIETLHRAKRYEHSIWRSQQYRERYPDHAEDVEPYINGRRSLRGRLSSHPLFAFQDSSESSDSEDEHNDPASPPPVRENATPSSNFPNTEDGFWHSREISDQSVNCDVLRRFIGYCNVQTDIKEASFFGKNGAYIVAGSDDGRAFIWEKASGKLVNAIEADEDIVNCVQPHPFDACLATSGIENVIRLWTPTQEDETALTEEELDALTVQNQGQMGNLLSAYIGAHPNIRLVFQPGGEQEGAQECATS